jgi:hypothetical protein
VLSTTLAEKLSVAEADEDGLCRAMTALLASQDTIEKKLAAEIPHGSSSVPYYVRSSYYQGRTCLVEYGSATAGMDRRENRSPPTGCSPIMRAVLSWLVPIPAVTGR